ncbi:clarin-3 [Macrotis lagotis]|uniref:clarin-3 n=1 Tax=Macrotis lagotis TaxID=92651 RepID=UPI003D684267
MPTTQKTLMFLSGFVTSLGSFVTVCIVLATPKWVTGIIKFSDGIFSNGSFFITYGLFRGENTQEMDAGLGSSGSHFEVLKILSDSSPKSIHVVVIIFMFFSLFTSLLSSGLTLFNSISNPYQTWLGPTSIFLCNGLNMAFIVLVLILFVVNTQANDLSIMILSVFYPMDTYIYGSKTHLYQYSFWLLLLILFFNITTIIIIVYYQKAKYYRKKELQKPMEEAPKDGILF